MVKREIKQLARISYTKTGLDAKTVSRISKILNRSDLKNYIKFLKLIGKTRRVTLFVPSLSGKRILEQDLKKLFLEKQISIKEDKSILAGIKLINNDNVYDFNLKDKLNNLVAYINQ